MDRSHWHICTCTEDACECVSTRCFLVSKGMQEEELRRGLRMQMTGCVYKLTFTKGHISIMFALKGHLVNSHFWVYFFFEFTNISYSGTYLMLSQIVRNSWGTHARPLINNNYFLLYKEQNKLNEQIQNNIWNEPQKRNDLNSKLYSQVRVETFYSRSYCDDCNR